MNIGEGLAIFGSAPLITKLLGPTADYIGASLKGWTEKRVNNVKRIFDNATNKLGDKIDEPGSVPPSVLKAIFEEGSYSDNFIYAEYFGGVLASSRSGIERDDRGKVIIAKIQKLSSYQLRTHYILYHILRIAYLDREINLGNIRIRNKIAVFIRMKTFIQAMDFTADELNLDKFDSIMSHCIVGLENEDLIGPRYAISSVIEDLKKLNIKADGEGIVFTPSITGASLFLWAYGHPNLSVNAILNGNQKFEIDKKVIIKSGFYA